MSAAASIGSAGEMSACKRAYNSERKGLAGEPAVTRSLKHYVGLTAIATGETLADSGLTGYARPICVLNSIYFDTVTRG